MPWGRRLLLLACLLLALPPGSPTVVLRPTKPGPAAALVLLQGASIPAEAYVPLLAVVQSACPLALWVVVPSAPLDVVAPPIVGEVMDEALRALASAGFNQTDRLFVAGHSLGGAEVQGWAADHRAAVRGQILLGAALRRIHRNGSYPVPTLTIGGGLDGLFRVTRVVEEYYHRVHLAPDDAARLRFPVVVVPGMSHMQFASGKPPPLVQAVDFAPEISEAAAHQSAGEAMAQFITYISSGDTSATDALHRVVAAAGEFARPLLAAYEAEGSRHFNAPQQIGGPAEQCPRGACAGPGSQWAIVAQTLIGDLEALWQREGWKSKVTNQYIKLSSFPPLGDFHLPYITHDATHPKAFTVATFAEGHWDAMDRSDFGTAPTSAAEVAAKLMSRQCVLLRGANRSAADAPASLDDPDFCAQANTQAYHWALYTASPEARARFAKKGVPLTFGPDDQKSSGPTWIYTRLSFTGKGGGKAKAERSMEVVSPALKTGADVPRVPGLPDFSCYHYCKLLSPARALEWVYVDSLRPAAARPPAPGAAPPPGAPAQA